jgi:hypothetical protein
MTDWDAYLLRESGLPGPRGNLELAQAVAEEGDRACFERYLGYGPEVAPTNTPQEFLAFCGVVGLGRLMAEGDRTQLAVLRAWANDPRWRLRGRSPWPCNATATRISVACWQPCRTGQAARCWSAAVVAALCGRACSVTCSGSSALDLLDRVTASLEVVRDRRDDGFIALCKALGYGWSVAVAAHPETGKPRFERWLNSPDPDVRWVMRENLKKNRLLRIDPAWVEQAKNIEIKRCVAPPRSDAPVFSSDYGFSILFKHLVSGS